MNDMELIDEIVKRADEYQKQKEKDFAIAELEKIKEEISCIYENNKTMWDGSVIYIKEAVIYEIIDNHIKELKGENNE